MSTKPQEGDPPTVVAIQQGKAHELVNGVFRHLLDVLHNDLELNLVAATCALLAIATNLLARLNVYQKYPYNFVAMCRKWFPSTYRHAITMFF